MPVQPVLLAHNNLSRRTVQCLSCLAHRRRVRMYGLPDWLTWVDLRGGRMLFTSWMGAICMCVLVHESIAASLLEVQIQTWLPAFRSRGIAV